MSDVADLTARVAALEALLQRVCTLPMVALALGGETIIRSTITPAVPEHRPGGSENKPGHYEEALRAGTKLAAIARRDRS